MIAIARALGLFAATIASIWLLAALVVAIVLWSHRVERAAHYVEVDPARSSATQGRPAFVALRARVAEPGPLAELERSTEAGAIARCMGGLDEKQRQAIRMAFFEGLTHIELAEKLGQPLGTVKTWVRRGLMKLKDCLGAAGIEGS